MQISRRIQAEIPTVQYGNVTFDASISWDTTVDGGSHRDSGKIGRWLDNELRKGYCEFHDTFVDEIDRLTQIKEKKSGKKDKTKRKEAIHRRARSNA